MSGTTKQRAVHEIRLKPNKDGTPNVVKPKEVFDCPNDDLDWLQKQGACVDVEGEEASAPAKPAAKKTSAEAAKAAPAQAPAKTETETKPEADEGAGEGDGDGEGGDGDEEDVL